MSSDAVAILCWREFGYPRSGNLRVYVVLGAMSDAEKLVEAGCKYPDDPLVLRPQVGGDLLQGRSPRGFCRPRSFILRLMLICVILATIAGCILIIFAMRHSSAWPWHRHAYHAVPTAGFCRALTPFPGLDVEERFLYEPSAITITHGPVAGFPAVSIFHLLNDAMTVMRTHGTCYVYPFTREVSEAVPVDETVIERIKGTHDSNMVQFKSPFGMRLFMVSPNRGKRIQINHPAASTNCSDVPIFRLVEMVLSQTSMHLDPTSEAAMSPVICSKECPPGESRDSSGAPRQVCRCPPKETPLTDLSEQPAAQLSLPLADDEGEAEDGDALGDSGILSVAEAWPLKDEDKLVRQQRAAKALHSLEPSIKIPQDCRVVEKVLEGAFPTGMLLAFAFTQIGTIIDIIRSLSPITA
ncbi:hypothetical protein ECG_06497 [Echinococcus granulosus]|uniref:Expressed conserved protein n=1 Tax=Echinococcus granulosus TaxID=6210 RepID=A0A068WP08_ECHGR|nr:hypothetical protein ECG_06497 [Echinococcus granulosus]CDS19411.1 expressed conserved protein [Echinococcus granulosus]